MIENKFPGKDISAEDIKSKIPLAAKRSAEHVSTVTIGSEKIGNGNVAIFAGPNMVESEKMIVETAKAVKRSGANFLRGGAFKPLTFPYRSPKYCESGVDGLRWLEKAKEETDIKITTEVMDPKRIKEICQVADILQIGTRNMQNYPLLVECAQTGYPILLKRGYGASMRDFLGAAEYILKEGNEKVILCERGIVAPHTHRETSRFLLDLQIVPALKEITHLPVITDPSHATFWRNWVEPMTLASIGAGVDGVMLEVHPDPENAAVDPLQAIDYESFERLMRKTEKVAQVLGCKSFGAE